MAKVFVLLMFVSLLSNVGNRHNRTWKAWKLICLIFMCGLFGGPLYQNFYLESLRFMSATFATAIINLTPVVTFILTIILGSETLELKTSVGKLKIIGIILSQVGGALLTFCHRMEINIGSNKFDLVSHVKHETGENHNLVLGVCLAVIVSFCNAISLILMEKIKEMTKEMNEDDRESILLIPTLIIVMGAIQATIYALCVEKDWAQWKLGWDIRLWTALFVGVIGSGLNTTIITFCVSQMGPVFVSSFTLIGLILMVVIGPLVLNEKLYLTSLMAIVIIIIAIAMLLYGKLIEMPTNANTNANANSNTNVNANANDNANAKVNANADGNAVANAKPRI